LFLKYTRNQEEAADRHAVQYLTKLKYPPNGLVNLLESFNQEMVGYSRLINEYALTHPVSKKRIDYLKSNFSDINFSNKLWNKKLQPRMNVVLAKLEGFIDNPDEVLQKYHDQKNDIAKYACAIAFHRKGESIKGLKLLDEIISSNKDRDGFLYELKAQILFESGNVNDSIIAYNEALKLLSARDAASIKISFALAIITLPTNDYSLLSLAIKRLKEAQGFENNNPFLYQAYASAYHKINDEARSLLALAEYNFLIGDKEKTRKYAKTAKEILTKENNKEAIKTELARIGDLLELAKDENK